MVDQSVCSIDRVKVLIVGESGVGKTSFAHLLTTGRTLKSSSWTVGCNVEVLFHDFAAGTAQEEPYFVELWDIGGSKTLQSIRKLFISSGTHGIVFVHDLTNRKSLQNLKSVWLPELQACQLSLPLPFPSLLVGTHYMEYISNNRSGNGHSPDMVPTFLPQWSTAVTVESFARHVGNCECISIDCADDKYIAPGTSNAVVISRFFDKVINAKRVSQQAPTQNSSRRDVSNYNR